MSHSQFKLTSKENPITSAIFSDDKKETSVDDLPHRDNINQFLHIKRKFKNMSHSQFKPTSKENPITSAIFSDDKSYDKKETSVDDLPLELESIILDYLENDIHPIEKKDPQYSSFAQQYADCQLFRRNFHELMRNDATHLANLILTAKPKEISEALHLVKKKPLILTCPVTVKDCKERYFETTPLRLALMTGDVNLKPEKDIEETSEYGLLEQLILSSGISNEEVKEHLEIITSKEALEINKKSRQCAVNAIKKFGEAILEIKAVDTDFESFQIQCEPLINQYENELKSIDNQKNIWPSVYLGILYEATQWYEDKLKLNRFGDHTSLQNTLFLINGLGKIQARQSECDKQISKGLDSFFGSGYIPRRSINYHEGCSYDKFLEYELGRDFYINLSGEPRIGKSTRQYDKQPRDFCPSAGYKNIIDRRNYSIYILLQNSNPKKSVVQV